MGIVRLDDEGNLPPGSVAGSRPGDEAARESRRPRYAVPVASTDPKPPVSVTTDGTHVSVRVGEDKPTHYENRQPAAANTPRITNREMVGGQHAESEIARRADLQRALPPEKMEFLRSMARNGNAIIIEHAESPAAPAATPRGTAVATRQK